MYRTSNFGAEKVRKQYSIPKLVCIHVGSNCSASVVQNTCVTSHCRSCQDVGQAGDSGSQCNINMPMSFCIIGEMFFGAGNVNIGEGGVRAYSRTYSRTYSRNVSAAYDFPMLSRSLIWSLYCLIATYSYRISILPKCSLHCIVFASALPLS